MSELPPELAVEPEPTDADPPPEAIRPDRPRIWPEEPRAPRPQIKRPMEEWLAEIEERGRHQDAPPREQPSRRPRPRGLARMVRGAPPARREGESGDRPAPAKGETGSRQDPQRRRRRRGRGRGRGQRLRGPPGQGGPPSPGDGAPPG